MQCPRCSSPDTKRLISEMKPPVLYVEYGCLDCRVTFAVTGHNLPIEWSEPIILHQPIATMQDILRRLKRGPLPRREIPDVLYQAMLDKGLISGERVIRLKSVSIGRQSGRARRGDLTKIY